MAKKKKSTKPKELFTIAFIKEMESLFRHTDERTAKIVVEKLVTYKNPYTAS